MLEYVDGFIDLFLFLLFSVIIRDGCCLYGNYSLVSVWLRIVLETWFWGFFGYILWGLLGTGVLDKVL